MNPNSYGTKISKFLIVPTMAGYIFLAEGLILMSG